MLGAGVIFLGACVAMLPALGRLLEARAGLGDAEIDHGYDAGRLRGGKGDYAIVEGEGEPRSCFFFFFLLHGYGV